MGHDEHSYLLAADTFAHGRGVGILEAPGSGKRGFGVSVEFKVKNGPITILGMTQTADGRLKMIAAEGESIPGPIMRIGNTNSRIRFASGPTDFFDAWCAEGPTHHVALGRGHQLPRIRKVAELMGLELAALD